MIYFFIIINVYRCCAVYFAFLERFADARVPTKFYVIMGRFNIIRSRSSLPCEKKLKLCVYSNYSFSTLIHVRFYIGIHIILIWALPVICTCLYCTQYTTTREPSRFRINYESFRKLRFLIGRTMVCEQCIHI
jgi:hypothetical protein